MMVKPKLNAILVFLLVIFTINSVAAQGINTPAIDENKLENAFFSTLESPWVVVGGLAYHSCRTCKFREPRLCSAMGIALV
jgi:hypothetical protein